VIAHALEVLEPLSVAPRDLIPESVAALRATKSISRKSLAVPGGIVESVGPVVELGRLGALGP
jgi:hypothetical protein